MPNAKITALLALAGALLVPATSNAILVTLDNPNQTFVRPTTGTALVEFTGHVTLTDGFQLTSTSSSSLWSAAGDLIEGVFPRPTFLLDGVLFRVTVGSDDPLGLYAFDITHTDPAYIIFSECPIGGGFCNNTGKLNYSINLVDSLSVPEPATLALLGVGLLAGVVMRRRRRA